MDPLNHWASVLLYSDPKSKHPKKPKRNRKSLLASSLHLGNTHQRFTPDYILDTNFYKVMQTETAMQY